MAKLELTPADLQNIVALCDMGVRVEGLKVAPTLYTLAEKINAYLEESAKEAEEAEEAKAKPDATEPQA